jgi:hypothetical protein
VMFALARSNRQAESLSYLAAIPRFRMSKRGRGRIIATTGMEMTRSEIVFLVRESPEGGFEARALRHAVFTQADSMDELKAMLRDAVACHFSRKQGLG